MDLRLALEKWKWPQIAHDCINRHNVSNLFFGVAPTLLALYICSVLFHIWLLKSSTVVPYVAHDEVQYALLGENLRAGHGFLMRGAFHSTAPPLFPLFVALGHSLASHARAGFFFLSVFTICLTLLPVYGIARHIDLSQKESVLIAGATSVMPQTFYSGMYMSETLHLPLFFLAFWLCLKWLDRPGWRLSVALGSTFGLMSLNRIAAVTPLICFTATAVFAAFRQRRTGMASAYVVRLMLVLLLYCVFQGSWWAYKALIGVNVLGTYASSANVGIQRLTWELFLAYIGDGFLAPGLIVCMPFLLGLSQVGKRRPSAALLLGLTPIVLIISTALSDGNLTGFLRERYYIYAFPLIMVVAVRGVGFLGEIRPAWLGAVNLFVFPMALLLCVLMYQFTIPPLVETSWAHAVGFHNGVFTRTSLLVWSCAIIAAVGGGLLLCPREKSPIVLASFLFIFNLFAFDRVATGIEATVRGIAARTAVLSSLFPKNLKTLQPVIIAGVPPGFEQRSVPVSERFVAAQRAHGLTDDFVWYLETMRLLDVRMCGTPSCVFDEHGSQAFFLTTLQFPNLRLVNQREGYYLYQLGGSEDARFSAKPIAPAWKLSPSQRTGKLSGNESLESVSAQSVRLDRGVYRLTIDIDSSARVPLRVEVAPDSDEQTILYAASKQIPAIEFAMEHEGMFDFRIIGPKWTDPLIRSASIVPINRNPSLSEHVYSWMIPPSRFATMTGRRRLDGSIGGVPDGQTGYLVYGPYDKPLPSGAYKVEFLISGTPSGPVRTEVFGTTETLASSSGDLSQVRSLKFTTDGQSSLQFRVFTKSDPSMLFEGVQLTPVN